MSALDKLINLLEKLRQEDPSFHDKAAKALDILVDEDSADQDEVEVPPSKPKYVIKDGTLISGKLDLDDSLPPEPEVTEEAYDSYAELSTEHFAGIVAIKTIMANLVSTLGLLTQNYESDKETLLERIEQNNVDLNNMINNLAKLYNLDPGAEYALVFPDSQKETMAFVKKEST